MYMYVFLLAEKIKLINFIERSKYGCVYVCLHDKCVAFQISK